MSYVPQAGTIPARVIAHLKLQPVGTEIPSAVLAEALGVDANIGPYLRTAIDAGLVSSRRPGGVRWVVWSLGDVKKREPEPDLEGDDDQALDAAARRPREKAPVIPVVDPSKWKLPFADETPQIVVGGFGSPAPDEPVSTRLHCCEHHIPIDATCEICVRKLAAELKAQEQLPAIDPPLPRVRAGTAPARWGIFSDGDFHIQKAGAHIVLERAEFEQLVAFLERMAVTS